MRHELVEALLGSLREDRVLCLPSSPDVAPPRGAAQQSLEAFRARALELTSIAGLASLPQITLPMARIAGAPLGLSLVGARGADAMLLALGRDIAGGI